MADLATQKSAESPTPEQITGFVKSFKSVAGATPGVFLMLIGVAMIVVAIAFKLELANIKIGSLNPDEYVATLEVGLLVLAAGAGLHAAVIYSRSRSLANAKDIVEALRGTVPRHETPNTESVASDQA